MAEVEMYSIKTCRKALSVLDQNPDGLLLSDMRSLVTLGLVEQPDQEHFGPTKKLKSLESALRSRLA
jgi:hypothetical protein